MAKRMFKPGTMLNPVPVVMVSCGKCEEEYNIITIAWTGIVNTDPPMTYVSVRKSRHSHDIIERNGEFVINLCNEQLAETADFCGVRSGRDVNKFKERRLTAQQGERTDCPMIAESPVNLECRVTEVRSYPSHDMFVAEILAVHVDETLISSRDRIQLEKAGLVCYSHGEYFPLKRAPLGRFGYSVMKPRTRKRLAGERRSKTRKKR